jgi:ABC-2 type transport system ATP-binding protein
MDDVAIKVDNVSKTFKLPHEKNNSIKSSFVNFYRRRKGYELQEALKDVSFEVKRGEFFGIVGRNGSGKSTLLKLLAGIYMPSSGGVAVNGSLTPFIELGVGFNPELTGRENVFLNGALLGFSRKEMHAKYRDIVEFAELEKFMDQKLKNYSSGMQVRLAFSIAIRAQSDILLIDEVLAVGDAAFQKKCYDYFVKLRKDKRTVILVTHDMQAVQQHCDRVLVIDQGKVIASGSPADTAALYLDTIAFRNFASGAKNTENIAKERTVLNSASVKRGEKVNLRIKLSRPEPIDAVLGVSILKNGQYLAGFNSRDSLDIKLSKKPKTVELSVETSSLAKGRYNFGHTVFSKADNTILEERIDGPAFEVVDQAQTDGTDGILHVEISWKQT